MRARDVYFFIVNVILNEYVNANTMHNRNMCTNRAEFRMGTIISMEIVFLF